MTVDLSGATFEYDFFSIPLPSGDTLIFNLLNEDLKSDTMLGENSTTKINRINIVVAKEDSNENALPVIGIENEQFKIYSEYEEYQGKTLDKDNIAYCVLEIFEDE